MDFNRIRKSFKSIRAKAILLSIIMIAATMAIMATYLIRTGTTLLKEELKIRALALSENFSRNCDYSLLLEDVPAMDKLASSMLQSEDVFFIRIKSAGEKVLLQKSKRTAIDEELGKSPAGPNGKVLTQEAGNALLISVPVWPPFEQEFLSDRSSRKDAEKNPLGRVSIGFSLEKRNVLIRHMIVSTVLITIVLTMVAVAVFLFLANRLINPLLVLVQGTRELSKGRLAHRVGIKRADEIGELAGAFNEMAQSLENSREQLEEYSQTLEKRVRERTEALAISEAHYRAFFESTGTAMLVIEEDGKISLVNAEFDKMLGFKREEIEEKVKWAQFIIAEDLGRMEEYETLRATDPQAAPKHYEFRTIDKHSQMKDIFATVSYIPGTPRKIASLIDISDRKRLENQLHQAQKMEAIGTLAGGIAHDFNNILMGIQGYASLALLTIESHHPLYEFLHKIPELVQSGANLTRQLLGFARGGKYEVKPTNLNEMVEKTASIFGRTKKEVRTATRFSPDLWPVEVDRGQIEQILLNLYVNAWQAMPGGGNLLIETANMHLAEDYTKPFDVEPGPYVRISVTDSGVGMDEKTKRRIFEPFFTTKEMGRGTGLGLATVYGIVKGHKGIITVYSEIGHGTSFHIYFPASQKELIEEKLLAETLVRGSETILLVDDETEIVEVSKGMLEKLGYQTIAAASGMEAMNIYKDKRESIDLVILDMIMPEMSGSETFDELVKINPAIKVMLCSGYSLNTKASEIMQRGCKSFIQKPFTIYSLSQKIRETLSL